MADYALFAFGIVGCIYTTTLTVTQWITGPSTRAPNGHCDA